jgi:glycosyltransferase involved in cell wall biosynthesis
VEPVLSVVVPARSVAEVIGGQLDALAGQTFDGPWELVISDNGSTDDTVRRVMEYRDRIPGLRVVDSSSQPGLAGARNLGVEAATADRVAFCDADDLVSPEWVGAMAEALTTHDLAGGPCRLVPGTPRPAQLDGWAPAPPPAAAEPPATLGCNLGTTKRLFAELGGFDPLLNGAEDIDYCWRAHLAGHELRFAPAARVLKSQRTELGAVYRQHRAYGRAAAYSWYRYRNLGYPSVAFRTRARELAWLGLRSYLLLQRSGRDAWVRVAGREVGFFKELRKVPRRRALIGTASLTATAGSTR